MMKSVDDTRANPRCTVLSVKPTWKRVIGLSCMQRARRSVSEVDGKDTCTARRHVDMIIHGVTIPLIRIMKTEHFALIQYREINKIFTSYYFRIS